MLALFLGAGFSKWAANLPLGNQLFDFSLKPFGVNELRKLERVKRLKQHWDSANPKGLSEQFIADILSRGTAYGKNDVLWYLVRRLSEPYIWQEWHAGRIRRHVLMIDENRKWDRAGVRSTSDFIIQCGMQLFGIITLNYDLLVEYALGSRGFNYGSFGEVLQGRGPYPISQWRTPVMLRGRLPLAKLHGSISWDMNGRYTDGRRGLSGKALIVAPTPEKRPPHELEYHWNVAWSILRRVSRLLVFGFAFNNYDEAVLNHLKEAGRELKSIAIIDVLSRLESAKKLWPQADIQSFRPPPEGRDELRDWLSRAIK